MALRQIAPVRKNDPLEVVRHLAATIGPRPATSLQEAQSAAYLDGRLRRAGMHVSADPFRAPVRRGTVYRVLAAAGVLAALLSRWAPLPALLLSVWLLLLVFVDTILVPLPSPVPHKNSQNIVGNRASEKPPRWRVVLLGAIDTEPRAGPLAALVGGRPAAVIGRLVAFGALAVLALLYVLYAVDGFWYGQALPAAYLLLLLVPTRTSNDSGLGNAGSLAVLLHAAERLTALRRVELWIVGVGAAATGDHGPQDFLSRYPFQKVETLFLSLEQIDHGHLSYAPYEGIVRHYRADLLLVDVASAVGLQMSDVPVDPRPYHSATSLARLLHRRGYRALTFVTHSAPAYRVQDDTLADYSSHAIEAAATMVVGIVEHLDANDT